MKYQKEAKLAAYGLINLDEFDKLGASKMPLLKNLMQAFCNIHAEIHYQSIH